MNIFNRFTLKSLKKNKTRTIVTIVGIILSTAMICAVTTFASSIQNYLLNSAIYTYGDWYGSKVDTDFSAVEKISESKDIKSYTYMQQLGYAKAEGSKNDYKPYLYILGAGNNAEDLLPIHIVSGTFPVYLNEILLPDHLASNGGIHYKIGDKIKLDIGERTIGEDVFGQDIPLNAYETEDEKVINEEILKVNYTREFIVSGFYERPGFENHTAPGYTAITIAEKTPPSDALFDIYFKTYAPAKIHDFMETNNINGNINIDYLRFLGTSGIANLDEMVISLAIIIMALIIFGSVALIYNAFSISVSERTKQFGLLSSVGATKKQLRKTVLFEALAVSFIGIPIGILSGIGGIGVTLYFVGNKFRDLLDSSPADLRVSVSLISVIIAVAIALVTVLISAWIPSKRATSITAVEAIRQNKDIKSKSVKTSPILYKLFGLPGVLAHKHYKRSKKKYRATVLSLFMSIVLFISASAFTNTLIKASSIGLEPKKHDLSYNCYNENMENTSPKLLLEKFKSCTSVTDAIYFTSRGNYSDIDKKYLSDFAVANLSRIEIQNNENPQMANLNTVFLFVNDSEFKRILKEKKLDENTFINTFRPLGIAIDGRPFFDYDNQKYIDMELLKADSFSFSAEIAKDIEGYYYHGFIEDKSGNIVHQYYNSETDHNLYVPYDEGIDNLTFYIGSVTDNVPFYVPSAGTELIILYPESVRKTVLPSLSENELQYNYYFKSDNHETSYKAIKQVLVDNELETVFLNNYAANAEQERNIVTIIKVFAYGFIVLISLIAAANVFNTISTNISLRRREFAMLKSVGMSKKGFNRMMNFECLLYGAKALLYGIPVSIGISLLIWVALQNGLETGFTLPWSAIGISFLSVFAVVFISMLYSMSKIKKENPIDALKNENF
ncbi:MAG: ABC transporter permease [Clostridia bacterium]|nr:ABC transporter permease [Clostridia bacterium]